MEFYGAAEWWSYQGLKDGFAKNDLNPLEEVHRVPMPFSDVGTECQNCYLLGFYLGREIQKDVKEQREKRRQYREIREHSVSIRESQSEINRLRNAMG